MPQYKAILLDVDGTIMPNKVDGYPSSAVTLALQLAQQKLHVGIASARTLEYANHLFSHLGLTGPSILLGGCQIVDAQSKKTLFEKSIEPADFGRIVRIVERLDVACFIDEPDQKIKYEPGYRPGKPLNIYLSKLTEAQADAIKHEFEAIPTITAHKATDFGNNLFAINISHASVSKSHAVAEVAKLLEILPEEIIGVGDGYNDLPLLMACGLKVAVGNAVDELKTIADYIAPAMEDDGVVDVINRYVLHKSKLEPEYESLSSSTL